MLTRSRPSLARLCSVVWVPDYISAKRRGRYIALTAVRPADGSDGERTAWDAMAQAGKEVKVSLKCDTFPF